ncbi:GerAB/ArcD/ProY family transporter [Alkalicoccobacillus gibsonii]|uniref:GerAB/ArcD/ProY family transporter n=1 Tax=Alkalicoccobacillus gibsonii TaxID=79881 RepID=UPI001934839F|nr:endospore germination permease [Alkalicoccobacillus gibsonii]MBM0066613.1 endospore germination permease [Alkalicoccobacillus gibsonii]
MKKNSSITLVQFFWFFTQIQIAVSVLTLPYSIYKVAKTDGWLSMILAGIITQLLIFVIWKLGKRYPSMTFFELLESLLGKYVGKFVSILYITYFLSLTTIILIFFNFLISVWVLSQTPDIVKIPLFVLGCFYLLHSDLRIIARFLTIIGPVVLLVPFLACYAFFDSEPLYLLPVFSSDTVDILKGVLTGSLAMQGFLILSILYPYIEGSDKEKLLSATYANIMVTAIYVFTIIAAFVYFSPGQFEILPEPLLYMVKTISLVLIERIDLIFLAFWSVTVLATIVGYLYIISTGMATVFQRSSSNRLGFNILACVIITVFALIPQNLLTLRRLLIYIDYIGAVFVVVIPILLLLFAVLFKRREST